jgi:DNA modification methylase
MSAPYFTDDTTTLHHGDSLTVARTLTDGSVNSIVTSPPYFGLRDYGEPGQYGLEASPAEYVEAMRALFSELRRVLADDGTLWLNIGDSYYSGKGSPTQPDLKNEARRPPARVLDKPGAGWAKPKNLLGIPWRVAFALQDDGWSLRNAIVWHKPNAMPESVTDRLSGRYETVFLFSKKPRYWFDLDPIREPQSPVSVARAQRRNATGKEGRTEAYYGNPPGGLVDQSNRDTSVGKNPGDVWSIAVSRFPGSHFATMPPALAERCILAGCKPGGTIFDPFSGSGTTGMVAAQHGRKYVGIDLSREYLDLSLRTRLSEPGFDFGEAS